MRRRGPIVLWAALAGCGDAGSGAPAVPPGFEPERRSIQIVEGETVVIPVTYQVVHPSPSASHPGEQDIGTIGLALSHRTASAADIMVMNRTAVPMTETGTYTVELGLRALRDGASEGTETLVVRPVVVHDGTGTTLKVPEDRIEVAIADGPPPCSGVEVRVGDPVHSGLIITNDENRWQLVYTTEIVVEVPLSSQQVFEWLSPPDWYQAHSEARNLHDRTRTFNAWRVEPLGDRARHRITAQWWSGRQGPWPPLLDMQICGGVGSGKFVRCSPTECAVHDEGS